MAEAKNETGCGAVAGFQIPLGIVKRKERVEEMLRSHPDISEDVANAYFAGLSEELAERHCSSFDSGGLDEVADAIRQHFVREVVRQRVREVVRKKAGGGGFVLYSPNPKKKGPAKPVGNFPTKLDAKRAELARFPPKDPAKLRRLRRAIDRLMKDPKKRADAEKKARSEKGSDRAKSKSAAPAAKPKAKKEGLDLLRGAIRGIVAEALFREEQHGSDWEDYVGRLPSAALSNDKKMQKLMKTIDDRTATVLEDAFTQIKRSVPKGVRLKNFGIKKSTEAGKTYLAFAAEVGEANVEPIYIYTEHGVPKIEVSDQARAALTKADPDQAKLFRAELVTVQERFLDKVQDVVDAIHARDRYLTKLEDEVDSIVASMSPLEVSLLKVLLTKKYRRST